LHALQRGKSAEGDALPKMRLYASQTENQRAHDGEGKVERKSK
jgi:hypothetical protein